jgi:hypothetical protein
MRYQVNLWRLARTTKAVIVRDIEASSVNEALALAMRDQQMPSVHEALILPVASPRGTTQGWVWRYRCTLWPDGRLSAVER